jgi:Protein of unknown function (DUF2490)
MDKLTRVARYLAPGVLTVALMAHAAPCAAQEADAPTLPDTGDGRGAIFAPSAWLVVNAPVQKRVNLKLYGFYVGELESPVAQFDLPIRATKFLTITPSYMYNSVPSSGLNKLPPQPASFTDSYEEHQFRIDGALTFAVRKLEISARNMYVRRYREAPADDLNRYRGRLSFAFPVTVHGRIWKPFASYEAFYDHNIGWDRTRLWSGVTLPVNKRLSVQPSYLWESNERSRDIRYLLLGLIVNTR